MTNSSQDFWQSSEKKQLSEEFSKSQGPLVEIFRDILDKNAIYQDDEDETRVDIPVRQWSQTQSRKLNWFQKKKIKLLEWPS